MAKSIRQQERRGERAKGKAKEAREHRARRLESPRLHDRHKGLEV